MRGITKRFPGVLANDRIDFAAGWGEVHALIGENGAGKTTLMNILYGLVRADSGEVRVSGTPVEIASPRDAIGLGIGMVHQQFMLVPAFTALENIILGSEPARLGRTDYRRAETSVRLICERFHLPVDLRARVGDLSVCSQQKVEILKTLYRNARILILDEPTSVLAPQEAESLFHMLRRVASEAMCIILISHKLAEVTAHSDRVTVLRQGKSIACLETTRTTPEELARLMVGAEAKTTLPKKRPRPKRKHILEVRGLSVRGDSGISAVESADFELNAGEILGVAGVDGNGQRELVDALIGLRHASGSVVFEGREIVEWPVHRRLTSGIAYSPEDRRLAMVPEFSLQDNAILGAHAEKPFARWGILRPAQARTHASALITGYDIRAVGPGMPAGFLSGGNQQKLVLARVFARKPRVLIACQPTRGLDVSATADVHRRLLEARQGGAGILLVSHDLDEILALSDRIMVMFQGRIAGILRRAEASREKLGALMAGVGW